MTFVLRVSCGLHGRVRVSTSAPETAALLRRSGWGCVFLDGMLHLLRGETEAQRCVDRDPRRNAGDVCELRFSSCPDPSLPAFRIDHAEFSVLGDDVLTWVMPAVHLLPWPRVADNWYREHPDNQDDLVRSVRLRVASGERHGQAPRETLGKVPCEIRRAISREKWARLLRTWA